MWPDRVSNPGALRLHYAARLGIFDISFVSIRLSSDNGLADLTDSGRLFHV